MRIDSKVKIHTVAGEKVVFLPAQGATDMNRVVAFNGSAMLLYDALRGRNFSLEEAAEVLADRYHIAGTQALSDAEAWLDDMRRHGLVLP